MSAQHSLRKHCAPALSLIIISVVAVTVCLQLRLRSLEMKKASSFSMVNATDSQLKPMAMLNISNAKYVYHIGWGQSFGRPIIISLR
jgi:hypothetical protein